MAKCKVCHRPLSNPAHIAMGMGPVCAAKSLRAGGARVSRDEVEVAVVVDPAKVERVERGLRNLEAWVRQDWALLRQAEQGIGDETVEQARWYLSLHQHWLTRTARILRRFGVAA